MIRSKTYPSNSGQSPWQAEELMGEIFGRNRMCPQCMASLMLEIIYGQLHTDAKDYMKGLLHHRRWDGDSTVGFGLPPGSMLHNKPGVAYDTVEDIASVILPNGNQFILAFMSNSYEPRQPFPYDIRY